MWPPVVSDIRDETKEGTMVRSFEIEYRAKRFNLRSAASSIKEGASNFETDNLARFALSYDLGRQVWLGNSYYCVNILMILSSNKIY
jgi:hypothetical protein